MSTGGGPRKRPQWLGYVVGGVVFAVAAVVAVVVAVLGVKGMADRVDALQRVPVSEAGGTVALAEPGGYTVYYEAPGVSDSGVVDLPRVALERVDGSEPVTLRRYSSDVTYDFGGHEGRAVATFGIEQPGTYRVQATGVDADFAEVAVGRSVSTGLGRSFLRAVVIGVLGLVVGGGIAVWTAIRHFRVTPTA